MLTHPMLDQRNQRGLPGMAQAFAELAACGDAATLSHADWLGLLLDRETTHRRDQRLATRLRYARLRHQAVVEDVDYRAPRGLDRSLFQKLADGQWIARCSISGFPRPSPNLPSPAATVAMPASCAACSACRC